MATIDLTDNKPSSRRRWWWNYINAGVAGSTSYDYASQGTLHANWRPQETATITDGTNLTIADKVSGIILTGLFGITRPTTGTRTVNGKNVIDCNGVNNHMQHASGGSIILPQPYTIFTAFVTDTVAASKQFCDGGTSTTRGSMFIAGGGTQYAMFSGSVVTSSTNVDNAVHVVSATFNGASSKMYLDGVPIQTGNPGAQTLNGFTVMARYDGTANNCDGAWLGSLIYSNSLNDAAHLAVATAKRAEWVA